MSLLQAASRDNSSTSWVFRRIGTHVVMCFIGMTKVFKELFFKKNGRHFGCLCCKKAILPHKELFDFWNCLYMCSTHTVDGIVKIELLLNSFFAKETVFICPSPSGAPSLAAPTPPQTTFSWSTKTWSRKETSGSQTRFFNKKMFFKFLQVCFTSYRFWWRDCCWRMTCAGPTSLSIRLGKRLSIT